MVTVISGIAGIIVFLLTENMSNPMVMLDKWTILNAVILALGVVGAVFSKKRVKNNKDDDKKEQWAHTYGSLGAMGK